MQFIDMHCHILPGVDDGAADVEMTRQMLQYAYKEGIRCIVATPHHHPVRGHEPPEVLKEKLKIVREEAEKISKDLRVYLGTEIFFGQDVPEQVLRGEILRMNHRNVVLVEFSPGDEFSYIQQGIQQLLLSGLTVILAHCERYQCLVKDFSLVQYLVQSGVLLQVNAGTITGKCSRQMKKFITQLMESDFVFAVSTDAHDVTLRAPQMKEAAVTVARRYGNDYARRIFFTNAAELLVKKKER